MRLSSSLHSSPPPISFTLLLSHLFLDIDGSKHLYEEPLCVFEELLHLEVRLKLVEFLHLHAIATETNKQDIG